MKGSWTREDGSCRVNGCPNMARWSGLCQRHHAAVSARKQSRNATGVVLTDEQKTEVIRRLRKFEKPSDIAASFGVSVSTVYKISKEALS